MRRITPRTCLWPLVGIVTAAFALSFGLTFRSNHHCYAGTCGEWLFPLQARLHVVIWYLWISLSVGFLGLRAFQTSVNQFVATPLGIDVPLMRKTLRISGLSLVLWVCALYGIVVGVWWIRLRDYFHERGPELPGNNRVAAVALTGHLADITMGMVLLPVSRHSAFASFFKLSPSTTCSFHITLAYVLFALVIIHGALYASWAALFNGNRVGFQYVYPVLNPTYLYHEVWPGDTSALGVWRASLIFTGIVSSLIMLAMFLTSFPTIRRKYFNVFYFTHLFGIVAVIVICLHASTMFYCTLPGLSMWVFDWGMRLFELRVKLDSRLTALGNGWYSLALPLPRKRLSGCACHSPLAHFYIHHSQSSIREIHPFTTITHLASKKPTTQSDITVQFLFRQSVANDPTSQPTLKKSTQWTNKLASLVDEEKHHVLGESDTVAPDRVNDSTLSDMAYTPPEVGTHLRLEGPYFTPATPERYRTVVCLVAGTGLSGAIAIAAAFRAQSELPRSASPTLSATPPKSSEGEVCKLVATSNGHWQRCIVVWSVRSKDYVDMPFFDQLSCEGLEFRVHKTGGSSPRLDTAATLREICGEQGSESWVYVSGPGGFISGAEKACAEVKGLTWFAARWD